MPLFSKDGRGNILKKGLTFSPILSKRSVRRYNHKSSGIHNSDDSPVYKDNIDLISDRLKDLERDIDLKNAHYTEKTPDLLMDRHNRRYKSRSFHDADGLDYLEVPSYLKSVDNKKSVPQSKSSFAFDSKLTPSRKNLDYFNTDLGLNFPAKSPTPRNSFASVSPRYTIGGNVKRDKKYYDYHSVDEEADTASFNRLSHLHDDYSQSTAHLKSAKHPITRNDSVIDCIRRNLSAFDDLDDELLPSMTSTDVFTNGGLTTKVHGGSDYHHFHDDFENASTPTEEESSTISSRLQKIKEAISKSEEQQQEEYVLNGKRKYIPVDNLPEKIANITWPKKEMDLDVLISRVKQQKKNLEQLVSQNYY